MNRSMPISTVQQAVRARVCSGCGDRTPGFAASDVPRACEATCPLFRSLPRLWNLALRTDPMVGRFEAAMRRTIQDVAGDSKRRRQARALVATLRELGDR